jgi:hypothetical protein
MATARAVRFAYPQEKSALRIRLKSQAGRITSPTLRRPETPSEHPTPKTSENHLLKRFLHPVFASRRAKICALQFPKVAVSKKRDSENPIENIN